MIDEELAEEYCNTHIPVAFAYLIKKKSTRDKIENMFSEELKRAFLAGLNKAYEWHFVKDGDLPEKSDSTLRTLRHVIVAVKTINGLSCTSYGTFWNIRAGKFECLDKVYAWCDVPEPPEPPKE